MVDNGSSADQRADMAGLDPAIAILRLPSNRGFTGGSNAGIDYALSHGADYILCLNNDTVVASDFLDHLVDALESDAAAGLAAAAVYRYSSPEALVALGSVIRLDRSPPALHRPLRSDDAATPFDVDFGEGCALLMRREVAEATGGFDEAFFAYLEDTDLSLRARQAGWRSIVVPRSRVWHKIDGKETGQGSAAAHFYSCRNQWRLVRKHASHEQRRAFYRSAVLALRDHLVAHVQKAHSNTAEKSYRPPFDVFSAIVSGTVAGVFAVAGDRRRWKTADAVIRCIIAAPVWTLGRLAFRLRRVMRSRARPAS